MKIPRSSRTVPQGRAGGNFAKLMVYAPIALEVLNMLHQQSKKKRGKYVKARKRDQAFDFVMNQANRRLGGKTTQKRRWF